MKTIKSDNNLYAGPNIFAAYQNLQKAQASLKTLFDAGLISQKHYSDTVAKLEDLTSMLYAPVFKNKAGQNYISKKQLQDAINKYVETAEVGILAQFKNDYIGQGFGYKKDGKWESFANDEVIYIPECGYGNPDDYAGGASYISDYPIWPDNIYTKQDFISLVGEERARQLFEDVDWQTPEILSLEYDWQTDYNETGKDAPEGFEPEYDEKGNYIPKDK